MATTFLPPSYPSGLCCGRSEATRCGAAAFDDPEGRGVNDYIISDVSAPARPQEEVALLRRIRDAPREQATVR